MLKNKVKSIKTQAHEKDEYPRKSEQKDLEQIIADSRKPSFVYVRGRRRVGKSWLLKKVAERHKRVLFFSGSKDGSGQFQMLNFVKSWYEFSQSSFLQDLKQDLLSWNRVFSEVIKYLKDNKLKITIIFDEIQWIAKTGSGFISSLKEAWIDFERYNLANIIVCGSSNKFFNDHVGGEEKILRGLQTRSSIYVNQIPLYDVKKYFFPNWKNQEIAVLYMMFGGIPYYLNFIRKDLGFINGINQGVFSSSAIFLEEIDEILGLEFNKYGIANVKKVLNILTGQGGSQAKVRSATRLSSSTISPLFKKLLDYKLIAEHKDYQSKQRLIFAGKELQFYINDFYINTFFSLIQTIEAEIKRNKDGKNNLFAHRILNNDKYYINDFTGYCYERLIRYCLETYDANSVLYKKLLMDSPNFEIYTCKNKHTQIDLIVVNNTDRIVRVVECKWATNCEVKWLDEVIAKKIKLENKYSRLNVIACVTATKEFLKKAEEKGVRVVVLADLFDELV